MKILVTGGSGFLGKQLTKFLREKKFEVVPLSSQDCDLTEAGSLAPYQKTKFDLLFHLAAWTQAGDFCLRYPGQQWIINQQINTNVLTWWSAMQPTSKLIMRGSFNPLWKRLP